MKFFNKLSNFLAVALLATATFSNAQTTQVTTSSVVKVQPINTIELLGSVELDLAQAIKQVNVTLYKNTLNNQKLLVSQAKTKRKELSITAKMILIAE